MESEAYDLICQICMVEGMVGESEVLKAQNCALIKFCLPMHSNVVCTFMQPSSLLLPLVNIHLFYYLLIVPFIYV